MKSFFQLVMFLFCSHISFFMKAYGDPSSVQRIPVCGKSALAVEMRRYGLLAYESKSKDVSFSGLFYSPRAGVRRKLPLVVYIPGRGETGDLVRQFRFRRIFDRVLSADFQKKFPCHFLAVTPPVTLTTFAGGTVESPSRAQRSFVNFVFGVAATAKLPAVDENRIYLTGFSYGGGGAYAIALHYPGRFAAVLPIAAIPPLPEYFSRAHPGCWWHFYNSGDYALNGIGTDGLREFAAKVNAAGGDFRIGEYPDSGHDAWTNAWSEDEVWEWMFSKSISRCGRQKQSSQVDKCVSMSLVGAKCSASLSGKDETCGPERAVDGLDATFYCPIVPFGREDWWKVEFAVPVSGLVRVLSGDRSGARRLRGGCVEVSVGGRSWYRAGSFDSKTGVCEFRTNGKIRHLRVRTLVSASSDFVLRRLDVIPLK